LRCAAEVVPWKERAKGYRNTETDNRNTYMILWRDIKMIKFIKNFRKDEAGAVTVDWVVLTAAVVGLGVAAYGSIESGATGLTTNVSTYMGSQNPN
jgi:Flp pilus assembly pilin Flp